MDKTTPWQTSSVGWPQGLMQRQSNQSSMVSIWKPLDEQETIISQWLRLNEIDKQTQERRVQALATWPWVKLHETKWAASKREYPVLWVTFDWITNLRKGDLKKLLSEHNGSEHGSVILCTQQKLTLHQGALYQGHIPTGETEKILWFFVPKAHWRAALSGCHRDTGHQGQQQTQFLLQDCF